MQPDFARLHGQWNHTRMCRCDGGQSERASTDAERVGMVFAIEVYLGFEEG